MMHTVENRFIAIVCGAMLIFVAPLVALYLTVSSDRAGRERVQTASILLNIGSRAFAEPLWIGDSAMIAKIAANLAEKEDIFILRVRNSAGVIVTQIPAHPVDFSHHYRTLSRDILYKTAQGLTSVGSIETLVSAPGLLADFGPHEIGILGILVIGIGVVFGSAIVGNRLIVIKPLLRLTAAIEATRKLGSRHEVDWTANDEMGTLAKNFNEMQRQLEQEDDALKLAHARSNSIYNLTPAMLFSVDAQDRITAVSDYWVTATGYERDSVIGRDFNDFVDPRFHQTAHARRQDNRTVSGGIVDFTVPFIKANGQIMTVLVLEMTAPTGAEHAGISLSVMTDVTELKHAESRNHVQAITDHLTGLLNRQGFEAALDKAIKNADERRLQLACIFIDLDRFKWINDNFGHGAGDQVLREVVVRIRSALTEDCIVSRLGGDEFAILMAADDVEALALEAGERICAALREPIAIDGTEFSVSSSLGIALYPVHAQTASDLLLKSDMAMYARKHDGKNGLLMFDNRMLDAARERHEIEQYIETGLKENWFEAYLQPIVGLSDGRIAGFEALMRLNHPVKGVLAPAKIIDIAEDTGTIGRIGDRILEKTILHLAQLTRLEGMQSTYVAINFSPLQFEPTLPHKLAALLLKHHISPTRIVVEITEAVLMNDNPQVHGVLNQLKEFGCRIALDDFGTGYSSLSYLNRFPVDIVKIDQSFTRSLASGTGETLRKSRMLIKGIRTISHQMGCVVVAEGIETPEQWELLRKLGLDYGQGYLFSKPMPIQALVAMLETESEAKTAQTA